MDAEQQVGVLLFDAAVLMVVGMAVVFGFLMVLVLAVQALSWLLRHSADPVADPVPAATLQQVGISPAVVAAITSAIEHHQKQNKEFK